MLGKTKLISKKNRLKLQLRLYQLLMLSGICLGTAGLFEYYQQTILSFKVSPIVIAQANLRASLPIKIGFEARSEQLPITQAEIIDGIWQNDSNQANHLSTSSRPGEGGNIVIYGHNTKSVFFFLSQLEIGQLIFITNQEGNIFTYQVDSVQTVEPDQIQYVLPTKDEVLTLYTCTGLLDSKRLIIKAKPHIN